MSIAPRILAFQVALALTAGGCGSGPAAAPSRVGGPISQSEIVARASAWWDRRWDPSMAYDPAAFEPDPQGKDYRRDGPGLVSMAWHLDHSRLTGDADSLAAVAVRIPKEQLRPGDVIVAPGAGGDGYALLFEGWVDADRTSYWAYEFGSTPLQHRTIKTSGDDLYVGDARTFQAYRYRMSRGDGTSTIGSAPPDQTWGDAPPTETIGYRPCEAAPDGKLYCPNHTGAALHASATLAGAVVNHLRTGFSWFDCWSTGGPGTAGSTLWYHTLGDDNGAWGWVESADVLTDAGFLPGAHGLRQCSSAPSPPPAADCSVHADGRLYCDNAGGAPLLATPALSAGIANHLRTTHSWFDCWGTGDLHAGGNTTWYYTLGDDNGSWGWAAAAYLRTSSAFDANPGAGGLRECTAARPPPGNGCSVHADGKLWCTNSPGAAIRASPVTTAAPVDALRTTYSWFRCWGLGGPHAGGNSTWYFTQGDDHGNWGWVAAVDMGTTSAFDANPASGGLARCPP